MQTVLVTGGNGFVGGWCVVELLEQGYAVRATVRSTAKAENVRTATAKGGADVANLSIAIADLTKDDGWEEAMRGCDYVLHVASPLDVAETKNYDAMIAPARDGTLRVLRAAVSAGVKRVVMTSAAAAARVPKSQRRVSDETVWSDPMDPRVDAYRRSKIMAERAAWEFMKDKQTEFVTVLPGAVFGPVLEEADLGSVAIIASLLRGRPSLLPKIALWIVDVRDLANLHVRAMTAPQAADQRFLGTGEMMWMIDIAKTLRARLGEKARKAPRRELPNFAARVLALFVPQLRLLTSELGRRNDVTSEKARRLLGFAPRPAADTISDCANSLLA